MPSAVAQGGAHRAAAAAPIEHFLALNTNPSQHSNPVVLGFGPIHAKGVDKVLSNRKDLFRFPAGGLVVVHHRVTGHQSHDPATCLTRFVERGTYQVVRGTRAYAGAHGHGRYVVHVTFVACRHQRPSAFLLEIRAHGPLVL